jgi:glycosyltransferase involved in cell wall biosynthesis
MDVLFLPDYTSLNPYQSKLAEELESLGHDVSFSDQYVFPLLRGYLRSDSDVIHYHWLPRFILADSPVLMIVKVAQFFLELTIISLVSNTTIVWTVHNRHEHENRWPTVERYVKYLFVILFCDRLIVHCSAVEDAIIEELQLSDYIRQHIDVVPHGNYIDVYENSISEEDARQRLGIPLDERVFLFIGSIRPYKQVRKLVDAFERAEIEGTLLIAGKPWNEEVRAEIESAISDNDHIDAKLALVPEHEFQIYFNAADAVVLPFREHVLTSGSVVLAMSFGTAVVVPRVGCLPEFVPEDGGILYDPAEDEALRTAIETAAEADLDVLGRRSFAAAQDLDWGSIACQTEHAYDSVLDE